MTLRLLPALLSLALVGAAAWLGGAQEQPANAWQEAAPGVWRSPRLPAGYALVEDGQALLIDAPAATDGLKAQGVKQIEGALLTHHHWDACQHAGALRAAKVPVRAAKQAAEWLTPENVQKYWQESIPLRHSRAAYRVPPVGLEGVDCTLQDGQQIEWRGWTIQVVATPGHARDHLAFAARKGKDGPLLVFTGDALASAGKLWTPYTTDWNHWTDEGLKPAAESLRKLAALKPARLLPAHGPVIAQDTVNVLNKTADLTAEVGFLKSFERFSKQRLGNAPEYAFLAKAQAGTNGKEPWAQLAPHLFLTGNTYIITSKDGPFLVIDPWGKVGADQIEKLRADRKLGEMEVMMFSHAHYDHYDGIYHLPNREKYQVWSLDRVAAPIAEPFRWRAPFLDARPIKFDRRLKDGETAAWREYRFRFQFFPGQSEFSMAVHTVIDGKKCVFTADNFFHQDQFSGSGGWMGLNRSFPLPYAESAQKVLDAAPDWVLAEHGGAFEFNAEDFKRRVRWGQACALACDAVSPSGNHRRDWDPHHVHVEPLVQKAKPGDTVKAMLVGNNPLGRAARFSSTVLGRDLLGEQTVALEVPAKSTGQREFSVRLSEQAPVGRHVFVLRVLENDEPDGSDAFFVIDVE